MSIIQTILNSIEIYLNTKVAYYAGNASIEELIAAKKKFASSLDQYIDYRLQAIILKQEKRYALEIEARMEAHEKAMSVVEPVLELDLSEESDILNTDEKSR